VLRRISITGPESTGKTWLAEQLAAYYRTVAVPEYAVAYLEEHGSEYGPGDIVAIAEGQVSLEKEYAEKAKEFIFCDTDPLVCKIWAEVVFGEIPDKIIELMKQHPYDLYLLCAPDIDWKPGPFRENPEDRDYLFSLYEKELKTNGFNYVVIKGKGDQRLKNAVNFVEKLLS
jgi:NadR type nicotinamide-nucleotide adenylyltransferase